MKVTEEKYEISHEYVAVSASIYRLDIQFATLFSIKERNETFDFAFYIFYLIETL